MFRRTKMTAAMSQELIDELTDHGRRDLSQLQTITYQCRGVEVTRQYKTFLATSHLVSAQIRVVIVWFDDGSWAPYFCTDTSAEVRDILEAAARAGRSKNTSMT